MTRMRIWADTNRVAATIAGALIVAVVVAGSIGVARATDQPVFCREACHEMGPYAQAWSSGPHQGVACVDCHVDSGMVQRLSHKVKAMGEVWSHVQGETSFPLAERSPIPNERCLRCHEKIVVPVPGFDHASHAKKGRCESCHRDAGHKVSDQALKDAGIFNASVRRDLRSSTVAVVDRGVANVPGHVPVSCTRCHDLAATGCDACHTPKHGAGTAKKAGECTACHSAGLSFAFTHPSGKIDCASCHEAPAEHRSGECMSCHEETGDWEFSHPPKGSECTTCHGRPKEHRSGDCQTCHKPGKEWTFSHPSASADCTDCHKRPAKHRAGACRTCHQAGKSWAFRHPGARSSCTNCHTRPARHRSGSCATCHRVGASWTFRHPGSGARCTACHTRPSKHQTGSCSRCHRTNSWTFRHSASSRCASCHRAPSKHFGASCSACHSPSRSWGSAKFSHPRIRGGEHSYRSFACSKCHPSGYSSATCSRCHKSSTGPKDDEDEGEDDD